MQVLLSTSKDHGGKIPAAPRTPVQPAFRGVLQDACATLGAQAVDLLDGIYVYGSVARGQATPGLSDLDLTLVLRQSATPADSSMLELLRLALQARHTVVCKIDFDIGHRAQVLAPGNVNSWAYWLKHHCRCIWGNDLASHFAPFQPSRAIALAVNDGFGAALDHYAQQIAQAQEDGERQRLQREAARKLIRATAVLRSEQEASWPQTLEQHAALLLQRYPRMRSRIDFFLAHAGQTAAPDAAFAARLRRFSRWLALQARR